MKEYWSTLSLIFNLLLFAVHGSSQIPQLDWGHCYGGDLNDYSYSCKIGRSGYIVAGCVFSSNGDITNPLGPADAWVMKLDTLGNIIWRNSYGGSSSDFFNQLIQHLMVDLLPLVLHCLMIMMFLAIMACQIIGSSNWIRMELFNGRNVMEGLTLKT
ncbi:MAG: hypothetical protein IPO39_06905 [Bacteroidetes bacterium]|nr:hypothetical protein [Bacteroidota bacterium]